MHLARFAALLCCALPALQGGDWPQWRGPNRDGHAQTAPGRKVAPGEPRTIWRVPAGPGFSSPVVARGKLVYCGGDGEKESAFCLDANTGKQLWKTEISNLFQDEWGAGTRATPIIDGDRVYVQSCDGEFRCLNLLDGSTLWTKNFEKDFGVKFLGAKAREGTASRRGNNGSGLVDGSEVIIPVGNPDGASVVALDKLTGRLIWKAGQEEAAYSSLMVADLAGARHVLAFMADSLMALDRRSGELLWRVPLRTNAKRHTATPLVCKDSVIVNSHTFGMKAFSVKKADGKITATEKWSNPEAKINLATAVEVNGHLYSHGPSRNFVSVNADTGKLNWTAPGFGKEYSATLEVGGNLIVVTDDGELVWIKPDPAKYVELNRTQIAGKNWNHPAFADGRLFVRDAREIACHEFAP
ncbi:MAG TPA: PQQ-binding-like beta-propeller repeat protein [Methylomirabilota bacterium]|nr:PQQ-binding-like beta-propeller repeat protein [Methylomirabilota bacterium]